MILQTTDTLSDCFFATEIYIRYRYESRAQHMSMVYIAIIFIVIPIMLSLYQLFSHINQHWSHTTDYVNSWLSKYAAFLLLLSLITGSSFSAVCLLNSNLFELNLFYMGLTNAQLTAFQTRRIWSSVILGVITLFSLLVCIDQLVMICHIKQNVPQICLQAYYLWRRGGNILDTPIPNSSMILSNISI